MDTCILEQPIETEVNQTAEESVSVVKPLYKDPLTGRFLPGNVANPTGRPKGTVSLKQTMKNMMTPENARMLVDKLLDMAQSGNTKAIELICQLIDEGRDNKITINTGNSILLSDAEMLAKAKAYTKSLEKPPAVDQIENKKE